MNYETWRSEPRTPYYAFARIQPTLRAICEDAEILTIPPCEQLRATGPVPVVVVTITGPGTRTESSPAMLDLGELGFRPLREADPRGYRGEDDFIQEDVRARMLAWCERYVREHPEEHLILRSRLSYVRNGYTAFKVAAFCFRELYDYENACREQFDPAVKRRRAG